MNGQHVLLIRLALVALSALYAGRFAVASPSAEVNSHASAAKQAPVILKHARELGRCTDCHGTAGMRALVSLSGEPMSLDRVPELCGQCHGIVKRDWDKGSHGKTVGGWRDNRRRLRCTECHDPHVPKFPQMQARPAPRLPKLGIRKEEHR